MTNRFGRRAEIDVKKFWDAVLRQDADKIRHYFKQTSYINWHCTNEHFTVEEFIQANCEYPGQWDGVVERIEDIGNLHAWSCFHGDKTAFFAVMGNLYQHTHTYANIRREKCFCINFLPISYYDKLIDTINNNGMETDEFAAGGFTLSKACLLYTSRCV